MTLQRVLSCLIPHSVRALPHWTISLPLHPQVLSAHLNAWKAVCTKELYFQQAHFPGIHPATFDCRETGKIQGERKHKPHRKKENCLQSFIYLSHFRMQTVKSRSPWMHYKALTAIFYNLLISRYIFAMCVKLWRILPYVNATFSKFPTVFFLIQLGVFDLVSWVQL